MNNSTLNTSTSLKCKYLHGRLKNPLTQQQPMSNAGSAPTWNKWRCRAIRIGLSIGLSIATWALFGAHYGWLDDFLVVNFVRGIGIAAPEEHFWLIHILFSKAYRFLYENFPGVPWYGMWLGGLSILSTYLLVDILWKQTRQVYSKALSVAIISMVYVVAFAENVFLLNFTRIGILLFGLSFVSLVLNSIRQHDYWLIGRSILLNILMLSGLLLRPDSIVFILPVLLVFTLLYALMHGRFVAVFKVIALSLFAQVIVLMSVREVLSEPGDSHKLELDRHYNIVVDGHNLLSEASSAVENPDYKALLLHYLPDETVFNKENLNGLGTAQPFTWKVLANWQVNLHQEYEKARFRYPDEYLSDINWFWKSLGFMFFTFLVLTYVLIRYRFSTNTAGVMIMFLVFYVPLFIVGTFYKMEDRLLNPCLILFSLVLVLAGSKMGVRAPSKDNKVSIGLIIVLTTTLLIIKVSSYARITNQLHTEREAKSVIISELNTEFKETIFFFDLWSWSVLHQSPFESLSLNPTNEYMSYGENFTIFFDEHLERLKLLCGQTDFLSVFNCLAERDDVVFVLTDFRKNHLEEFALLKYQEKICFERIRTQSKLSTLRYSLFWFPLKLDYYRLQIPADRTQKVKVSDKPAIIAQ